MIAPADIALPRELPEGAPALRPELFDAIDAATALMEARLARRASPALEARATRTFEACTFDEKFFVQVAAIGAVVRAKGASDAR